MHSSPPVIAPKLQLAVQQPSTEGCYNPPEKFTLPSKKITKPQQDGRRGTIMIRSNSIPTGWVTHKLQSNNTKKNSPTVVKVLNCMSGFPACGFDKRTGNPSTGYLTWKTSRI